ncbi:glycosyltransferase family 2 protein [Gramella sp. KN1008]|uniref:glycosyltransferase family 2 protein n=1 Tax=Gramella sp. KN1008 TaxID=2529298 RepID=UPI0010404564|nr:glycosyltransferase family A protein [Gramella sp. KN1008]TBW25662.1 glycosyltransferase family 2 protein [Gramella sp. KN1008]
MIFLIHRNTSEFLRAVKDEKEVSLTGRSIIQVFWELAEKFPEELIIWCEEKFYPTIHFDAFKTIFHHDLIMASYAIESNFLPDSIGYVDQMPFINVNPKVPYGTWRMSADIGGIKGSTLLFFKDYYSDEYNFQFLLNSIAKIGQQNGLFCYSNPNLTKSKQQLSLHSHGNINELFKFVAQHYKKEWLWVLLFASWKYEKKLPVISFIQSQFSKFFFRLEVDLPINSIRVSNNNTLSTSIDVIIPTLFRPGHVKNLLKDLRQQTKLPHRVIIVEQDPDPDSNSQLNFLEEEWPFEIIHHFVHTMGACHARNLALEEVRSNWVLFADDDIRIEPRLLENSFEELKRLGVSCLNLNSLQPGEKTVFSKIKQWGAFGSANALVKSEYALQCKFSKFLEYGFGEDIDYGMQLRNLGCDIIYHPDLQFTHLKANTGGFRTPGVNNWKEQELEPKPSPTMMFLIKQHYSKQMMKGFKISLFIKYYKNQKIINPFRYFRSMQKRWKLSESLCEKLDKTETKR